MSEYGAVYEDRFVQNLRRYAGLRERIKDCVEKVCQSPYANTEFFGDVSGKLNLRGCRSMRVNRFVRMLRRVYAEMNYNVANADLTINAKRC